MRVPEAKSDGTHVVYDHYLDDLLFVREDVAWLDMCGHILPTLLSNRAISNLLGVNYLLSGKLFGWVRKLICFNCALRIASTYVQKSSLP